MNKDLICKLKLLKNEYDKISKYYSDEEIQQTARFKELKSHGFVWKPLEPLDKLDKPNEPVEPERPDMYNICCKLGYVEFVNAFYEWTKDEFAKNLYDWKVCLNTSYISSLSLIAKNTNISFKIMTKFQRYLCRKVIPVYSNDSLYGLRKRLKYVFKKYELPKSLENYITKAYPAWYGYPYNVLDFYKELAKISKYSNGKVNIYTEKNVKLFKAAFKSMINFDTNGYNEMSLDNLKNYYFKVSDDCKQFLVNLNRNSKEPHYYLVYTSNEMVDYRKKYFQYLNEDRDYIDDLCKYKDNAAEWDEYYKELEDYNEEVQTIIKKVRDEIQKNDKDSFDSLLEKLDLDYPEKRYYCIDEIIDILECGLADDLVSALKYKDYLDIENKKIRENQSKIFSVKVYYNHEDINHDWHKDWKTVDVEAKSAAEAINAAMNMVANSTSAELLY